MNNIPLLYCVYDHPSDYPEKCVVRAWLGDRPTVITYEADTLEELRALKPDSMVTIPRMPDDDPVIVECWI